MHRVSGPAALVCLAAAFTLVGTGCSRSGFSLSHIDAYPTVTVTYVSENSVFVGQGLAVAALVDPVETGKQYQFSVTPPSGSYVWEVPARPFEAAGMTLLGASDLLLPPGLAIEDGPWLLEVLHMDGRTCSGSFEVNRESLSDSIVENPTDHVPRCVWELDASGSWGLAMTGSPGVDPAPWHVSLYDRDGVLLFAIADVTGRIDATALRDGTIRGKTASIVCSRYDERMGTMLVSRMIFK